MDYKKFILIIIIILLIYVVYVMFNKSSNPTSMNHAQNETIIPANNVDYSQSNSVNYSMTIWFYVEDWNYKYGEMKTVLSRGIDYTPTDISCPSSCINSTNGCCYPSGDAATANNSCPTSNNYVPNCQGYILQSFIQNLQSNLSNLPPCPLILLGESLNNIYIIQSIMKSGSQPMEDTLTSFLVPGPTGSNYDIYITLVENFSIQKWVNLTISFYNRTLDIYLDGKLVKTNVLPNTLYCDGSSDYDVLITPNGGFSGLTSGFQYYPNSLNPTQAWDIYTKGYSTSLFGGMFNKYKLKFSLMEGDIEDQSFEI